MKKAHSEIVLSLLLMCVLIQAFSIQQTKSEPIASVVPDDYATIQEAIDAASSGDTIFVKAGTYRENIVVSKAVSLVGENRATTIIDGRRLETVVYVTASNVKINGFTIRNSSLSTTWPPESGIILHYSDHAMITNCIITANSGHGLCFVTSRHYTISNCTISHNKELGIAVGDTGSSNGVIRNNLVYSNSRDGIAAYAGSDNTIVENNTVQDNLGMGVAIGWSSYCLIRNNTLNNNEASVLLDTASYCTILDNKIAYKQGIVLLGFNDRYNNLLNNTIHFAQSGISIGAGARYTTISGNVISGSEYGLVLAHNEGYRNYGNAIFHNDFKGNKHQAVDNATGIPVPNAWDDGYPSGGNYWSDYLGKDTNGDGIGDVPYNISGTAGNKDRYPLMKPLVTVVTAKVDVKPDTLNLRSGGKWITAYIELPSSYNVADIRVSSIMINDTVRAELKPTSVGDYDNDGIPDLMVKFDRTSVIRFIFSSISKSKRFTTITLTITGKLGEDTSFQGSDTIRAKWK